MYELWRTFGVAWVPHDSVASSISWWVQELPVNTSLWSSAAVDYLLQIEGVYVPLWIRPVKLGFGAQIQTLVGHTDWVNSVAFSADGRRLVSGSLDSSVRLWDVSWRATLAW